MSPLGKERLEGLQRALAATCRAIAHHPPSTSASAPAKRSQSGPTRGAAAPRHRQAGRRGPGLQLPSPRRSMSGQDLARLRGEADSASLRLRHHDAKVPSASRRTARSRRRFGRSSRYGSRRSAPGACSGSPPISHERSRGPPTTRAGRLRAGTGRPRRRARAVRTGKPARLRPARGAAGAARQLARLAGEPDRPGLERAARASGAAGGVRRARARAAGALGLAEDLGDRPEEPDPDEGEPEEDEQQLQEAAQGEGAAEASERVPSEAEASASADDAAETRPSDQLEEAVTRGADDREGGEAPFETPQYLPPAVKRWPIACSPPGTTRWSKPTSCAARSNSPGCACS